MYDELGYEMSRKQLAKLSVEQGFLTTRGRFVARAEARSLQEAAGIPSTCEGGYRKDGWLYSEDLY